MVPQNHHAKKEMAMAQERAVCTNGPTQNAGQSL
jgi:hypothetical protein